MRIALWLVVMLKGIVVIAMLLILQMVVVDVVVMVLKVASMVQTMLGLWRGRRGECGWMPCLTM
jgi:hypothetical protein